MPGFLVRLLVNVLGLFLASKIVPGLEIVGAGTFVAAALLLGVVNALVRPLVVLLTLPVTLLTLGLFLLVINGLMLELVAWLLKDFHLAGFGSALLGAIIVSLTSWATSWYVGPKGTAEVIVIETRAER